MTIKNNLIWAAKKFEKADFLNPLLESEIIISDVLKKSREYVITYPEKKLKNNEIKKFRNLVGKRLNNIPLAYIVGYKYFFGFKFLVNKNTLIPRPETELIVEDALNLTLGYLRENKKLDISYIDVGTGSGCIIISLVNKLIEEKIELKYCNFLASDISKKTLSIARKNAVNHKVKSKIKFFQGNLLKPILSSGPGKSLLTANSLLLITANLPYLTPLQFKNSISIQKEPKSSLIAGRDGLKYYKIMFMQIQKILTENAYKICLYCEIDSAQATAIKIILNKFLPKFKIKIKKDLRGLKRFAVITNY